MSNIPVALFNDRTKAEAIRDRLRQHRIPADVRRDVWRRALWFAVRREAGVYVEVPVGKFEQAERMLLDWDMTEDSVSDAVRCPECDSLRIEYPQLTRKSVLTNLLLGLSALAGIVEETYYCQSCHYTWPKKRAGTRRVRAHAAPFYFIERDRNSRVMGNKRPSIVHESTQKAH